jgi:hypothetical protein
MRRSGHNFGHKGTVISVRLEDDICNNLEVEVYSRHLQLSQSVGCSWRIYNFQKTICRGNEHNMGLQICVAFQRKVDKFIGGAVHFSSCPFLLSKNLTSKLVMIKYNYEHWEAHFAFFIFTFFRCKDGSNINPPVSEPSFSIVGGSLRSSFAGKMAAPLLLLA